MNRTIGAAFIVAGTSIGAGTLALPMATYKLGFIQTSLWLFIIWFLMYYAGLVQTEVNSFYGGKAQSISELANKSFGKIAKQLTELVIVALFYSLIAAYITGGSSIIHSLTKGAFNPLYVTLIFTLVFGWITASNIKWLDYSNRLMFIAKIFVFVFLTASLIPFLKMEWFLESEKAESYSFIAILFTSFGFHGSIPVILNYLKGDIKEAKKAFMVGSFIALVFYLIWCFTTLSSLPNEGFRNIEQNSVGAMIELLSARTSNASYLNILSNLFGLLAIITSLFGVGLGLLDFFLEKIKIGPKRILGALVTYLIPLAFALFYPKGFIAALGYAAIALSFIAVIIPTSIAIYQRYFIKKKKDYYKVWGGLLGLLSLLLLGVIVILVEIL